MEGKKNHPFTTDMMSNKAKNAPIHNKNAKKPVKEKGWKIEHLHKVTSHPPKSLQRTLFTVTPLTSSEVSFGATLQPTLPQYSNLFNFK